ncbi:MAG: hypothetical protein JKY34_05815 [Kordiimonadaceae bacterium]|nr:hypothetical protein [Kordiimonadaceae bacterium]
MTKHDEILKLLSEESEVSATLNNTITSPLGGQSDDMFLVTFHSNLPSDVMFTAYRSTLTINVTIVSLPPKPYKIAPGAPQTIPIPSGTKIFSADATDIRVMDPTMSFVCTTF